MNLRNRAYWKQQADQKLAAASYDPKKLTLFHGAVIVGFSLVISLLSILIDQGIANTGGLSGIQTRNLLQTVQSLLNLTYSIAQPFWMAGIVFAYICIAQNHRADGDRLLQGFRRFGPVLRLNLLKGGIFILLAIPCAYISSSIAMAISSDLYTLLEPIAVEMTENPNADMYTLIAQLPTGDFVRAILPMLIIFSALYLTVFVIISYRLRFASYLIVDNPRIGALEAMRISFRMTKGNCICLFLLDLSFWWYYVLTAAAALLAFADLLLPYMGVQLPISGSWATVVCYCIYGAIILSMDYTVRPRVEATYAVIYDSLRNPQPMIPQDL